MISRAREGIFEREGEGGEGGHLFRIIDTKPDVVCMHAINSFSDGILVIKGWASFTPSPSITKLLMHCLLESQNTK